MKLGGFLVTCAVAVVVVACSSSSSSGAAEGTAHCAVSALQCHCSSDSFSLASDESASTTCSADVAPAGQTWESVACCYDLDTDGFTTTCDCLPWSCQHNDPHDECICGYYPDDSRGTSVSGCSKNAHDSLCCQHASVAGNTDACSCNGTFSMCETRSGYEDAATVTTCAVVPRTCDGMKTATSCDGLKWKPPAPPSTSSSSGGGSSSGGSKECTSDSACSSKCGGDCYQCRSGSCSCGYTGTSGSCIF